MELTQLRYFRELAKIEHFTHAAEKLHVSQPSLSKAIANLEDELGVKVFERDKKAVYLSDYGKCLLSHVDAMFAELDEARLELNDMALGAHGNVEIASSFELSAPNPFFYYVHDFILAHRDIKLHYYLQGVKQMKGLLEERKVVFCLSSIPLDTDDVPGIRWIPLYSERMGIVVAPDHPLAGRDSIALAELKDERFLCNNISPDQQDSIYYLIHKAGFDPNIVFEGGSSNIVGEAVSRGFGIAFVSESRREYFAKAQGAPEWERSLRFLAVEDDFCLRNIGIAYLRHRYLSAAARLFLDGLIGYFEERKRGAAPASPAIARGPPLEPKAEHEHRHGRNVERAAVHLDEARGLGVDQAVTGEELQVEQPVDASEPEGEAVAQPRLDGHP